MAPRQRHQATAVVVIVVALSGSWCATTATATAAAVESIADLWYASTRCNELSVSSACRNYERCKATHRCARGDEDYYIFDARLESFTREFAGGERTPIALMNDFEDWKTGTRGWAMQHGAGRSSFSSRSLGWDSFAFPVIGSLELQGGYVVFDTDTAEVWGDVRLQGQLATTNAGTTVAVFNFLTFSLAKGVRVRFQGSNAVSLMSRSSLILDAALRVRPGTLGGFPGGGFVGSGPQRNNNQNGPGSPSVRVYVKTLSTAATHIPEVQEIWTSAAPGQKLQGTFFVGFQGLWSQPLRYDTSAYDLEKTLETTFPDIGSLHVERDDALEQVPEIGRLWRITFLTAVGNVEQLRVESRLTGLDAAVNARTTREGNALRGTFKLAFMGRTSRPLPHDATADALRAGLLRDFPELLDARVARTDATGRCLQGSTLPDQSATSSINPSVPAEDDYEPTEWFVPHQRLVEPSDSVKNYPDKLCSGGGGAAGGFVWKLQLWTTMGNHVATSPSSTAYLQTQPAMPMTVDPTGLTGQGATAAVVDSRCFSLAFGGGGGSFGGRGGAGYAWPTQATDAYAAPYSDDAMSDLLGGSGGAGGGQAPIDVFPVVQPTLGGAGGGAIQLLAVNDLLIGPNGLISVNGANGAGGFTAGGGGAAGSLLLEAGGVIAHHGVIEAIGGHGGASTPYNGAPTAMPGGGGGGGRVAIYAESFSTWNIGTLVVSGGAAQDSRRSGQGGSLVVRTHTSLAYRVDPTIGAAGTAKSLLVAGSEDYAQGSTGILHDRSHQFARNGPRYVLPLITTDPALGTNRPHQPARISFFVRVAGFAEGALPVNRGALFGVHASGADNNKDEFLLAIALVDGGFYHEANTFQFPRRRFQDKAQPERWYKVDLFFDWTGRRYSIHLNDVLKVLDAPFRAAGPGLGVGSLSLNNYHPMSSWWDEIYVGEDLLRGFRCPSLVTRPTSDPSGNGNRALVVKTRTLRRLWALGTRGPPTTYHPMVKHKSHVSQREVYSYNHGNLVPFDGAPHREFFNDVREVETEELDGTSEAEQLLDPDEELVSHAEMLTMRDLPQDGSIVPPLETGADWGALETDHAGGTDRSHIASHGPTIYWYSEAYNTTSGLGAIGACSTLDYVEWRNEGLMLHFVNLTDPFGVPPPGPPMPSLLADRPKVLYNKQTRAFVMWMHVDNANNTMGLSAVATSRFPNGPFIFKRSFYPDAPLESPGGQSINETHDQTLALVDSGDPTRVDRAYLIRTYFKTVEYWLPRPVMDPLWQSVQGPDNRTDFGLSYHRAFYHKGYDDPNDIYLQRWRMEDRGWEIECCAPTNASHCVTIQQLPGGPGADVCPQGLEKTDIRGQSQMPAGHHIRTRYKDPNDDANSFFRANSVPSHTSWGFQVHNIKTWRGNYFDALSTNITEFIFHRFAGERRRLELMRDPSIQFKYPGEEEAIASIPTSDREILDLLLGTLGVPMSVEFTDTYSSYDLAEIDINGDGKITSSEIATLVAGKSSKKLSAQLVDSLMTDFEKMKWDQVTRLDADGDGKIVFSEFVAWVGLDPNLMFDRFDLDKSGYLDENELARLLWYRQLPRMDTAIILLDPSFDGRVYYPRFREQLLGAPDYMFNAYDFDSSDTLSEFEIDLMIKDLGVFAKRPVVEALKTTATKSITRANYVAWLSATTSLLGDARDQLKVDNAVHRTRPDSLTGPLHVVERRRAKYVAISRLTDDYMTTEGLLQEIEGDFEGREALLNYFSFAEQLFGLQEDDVEVSIPEEERPGIEPYRLFLSSEQLHDRASYWNGRHWEGRPSAPAIFTYGTTCQQYAGVDGGDPGCMPCLTSSPYVTSSVDSYQAIARSTEHCRRYKELDAYIKAFDQQVAIQLQYQQQSQFGPQGLQPHMSPCYNQSQFFPCDVHKVYDGTVADDTRDLDERSTPWHLAWERHPANTGSSQKIRADGLQRTSTGPSYIERFPERQRGPVQGKPPVDTDRMLAPDEMLDIVGGGN